MADPARDMNMDGVWLIKRGGAYYRPNACGYTFCRWEAGFYTEHEARKHESPEAGVSIGPYNDAPAILGNDVGALRNYIKELEDENRALREAANDRAR